MRLANNMAQPRTKLSFVIEAMQNDDWAKALSLASKFQDLGPQRQAITRAHGCLSNPRFFSQTCKDMPAAIEAGKQALIDRYLSAPHSK